MLKGKIFQKICVLSETEGMVIKMHKMLFISLSSLIILLMTGGAVIAENKNVEIINNIVPYDGDFLH
jgi:hypothetical protein